MVLNARNVLKNGQKTCRVRLQKAANYLLKALVFF